MLAAIAAVLTDCLRDPGDREEVLERFRQAMAA